jgi:microcystin-dependent protein
MDINQFLGQLILAPFGFAPRGWAQCNGQIMAINQNQALFALLGTFFGGNGVQTFALPNLQGRTPIGMNDAFPIGANGGEAQHTLTQSEVPSHSHNLQAATTGANGNSPTGAILAGGGANIFVPSANLKAMFPQNLATVGGQFHENRQPYLVMNWCIALTGIFPSRN